MKKKFFKFLLVLVLALIAVISVYFVTLTVACYNPDPIELLSVKNNKDNILQTNKSISIITYNIGYCGLDKNQDSFLEGGKDSRSSSKNQTTKNMSSIQKFLTSQNPDLILLQEVDTKSTRSYNIDECTNLQSYLKEYSSVFAYESKNLWNPLPITKPTGAVYSGNATFSKYQINSTSRYKYPSEETWPIYLFIPSRCFIETRLPVNGGKELVLINTHLSAYDKNGELRKQQLAFLQQYIVSEYKKGNYIIVGGDFNCVIPTTNPKQFKTLESKPSWLINIPSSFKPEGFTWVADKTIPSVRSIDKAYRKNVNYTANIDGFLVSANIKVVSVNGFDLGFENSDHNPVRGTFILK